MKHALALVAVAGLIGSIVPAQMANAAANNPLIVWQGAATLTSVPTACASTKFAVGDSAFSIFRPRLDPAEPSSAISLTFGRNGHAYFRTGGASTDKMHGNSTYSGPYYTGRVTSTPGGATGNITLTLTPAAPVASTDVITIVGSITKFAGVAACTVGFKGAYSKRPN